MANYIIDGTLLTNIATAIRNKKGVSTTYTPAEMATAINGLAPRLDHSGTTHHVWVLEAGGTTISAGESASYRISTGASTYLDFSNIAFTNFVVECSGGVAYVDLIDFDNNRIRIRAGGDSAAHISSVNVGYVDLEIV